MWVAIAFVLCLVPSCTGVSCASGCVKELHADKTQTCNCCAQTSPVVDPCKSMACPAGTECLPKEDRCYNAFGLNCVHSVKGECKKKCQTVNCGPSNLAVYDMDGCKKCWSSSGKKNVCQGFTGCNPDQECYIECSNVENCNPVGLCRKKCATTNSCPKGCSVYIDTEGCPACSCCNPCLNKQCAAGEECVLEAGSSFSTSVGTSDPSKAMNAKCQKKS